MKKGYIKFYHPDEVLEYNVIKSFCKIVFSNDKNTLVAEIESDNCLEYVEEDSLQNSFPQVALGIEDIEVSSATIEDILGDAIEFQGFELREIEDGDSEEEIYYTNLNVNEEDFDTADNKVVFTESDGVFCINWKGVCDNFIDEDGTEIKFEVNCSIIEEEIELSQYEEE